MKGDKNIFGYKNIFGCGQSLIGFAWQIKIQIFLIDLLHSHKAIHDNNNWEGVRKPNDTLSKIVKSNFAKL